MEIYGVRVTMTRPAGKVGGHEIAEQQIFEGVGSSYELAFSQINEQVHQTSARGFRITLMEYGVTMMQFSDKKWVAPADPKLKEGDNLRVVRHEGKLYSGVEIGGKMHLVQFLGNVGDRIRP